MAGQENVWICKVCGYESDRLFCLQCGTLQPVTTKPKKEKKRVSRPQTSKNLTVGPSKPKQAQAYLDKEEELAASIIMELRKNYRMKSMYYNHPDDYKAQEKIKAALNAYGMAAGITRNDLILACQDETLFGGGEDGLIFTMKGIYIKCLFEDAFFIKYDEIKRVRNKNDNMHIFINDYEISLTQVNKTEYDKFCSMVNFLCNKFGNTIVNSSSQRKFCKKCGKQISNPNSKFCISCGATL